MNELANDPLRKTQSKFNEYHSNQGSRDEVCTNGSKIKERVWAAVVICNSTAISRMLKQLATTCPKDSQTIAPSLLLGLQP